MTFILDKKESKELRKKLSIELCDTFILRLKPYQAKKTKIGALIAIKNFIKESNLNDQIIYSCLVDSVLDEDKEITDMVLKILKEVINSDLEELLEMKLSEVKDSKIKAEIKKLLKKTA